MVHPRDSARGQAVAGPPLARRRTGVVHDGHEERVVRVRLVDGPVLRAVSRGASLGAVEHDDLAVRQEDQVAHRAALRERVVLLVRWGHIWGEAHARVGRIVLRDVPGGHPPVDRYSTVRSDPEEMDLLCGLQVSAAAEQDRGRIIVVWGQRKHGSSAARGVHTDGIEHVIECCLLLRPVVQQHGLPVRLYEEFSRRKHPC